MLAVNLMLSKVCCPQGSRAWEFREQRASGLTISHPRQTEESTPGCPTLARYCSEEQAHMLQGYGSRGRTEDTR